MPPETRSLWEQLDSEVEPWRRGRMVLIVIGLLHFAFQALLFAAGIALGDTEGLVKLATVSVLFWLQFYFIWIGVSWVRWMAGAWAGAVGFVYLIWGWRDDNAFLIVFGCINLVIGTYFCLSPSVYFFAKRQQERRNWRNSLAVAAVFGLLSLSLCFGSIGLSAYRQQLEADAREFADQAFAHIFTGHDTYFFLDHMTKETLQKNGGRDQATKFLQSTTLYAGDVHNIKGSSCQLKMTYEFPAKLVSRGLMITDAVGERGVIQLHLTIVDSASGWQIENIWWQYP